MKLMPLVVIVVFVLLVGSSLGTTFLWVIAGLSTTALIVLMAVMYRADSFVGPASIISEAREGLELLERERESDASGVPPSADGDN